jgi:hypothetical protein
MDRQAPGQVAGQPRRDELLERLIHVDEEGASAGRAGRLTF